MVFVRTPQLNSKEQQPVEDDEKEKEIKEELLNVPTQRTNSGDVDVLEIEVPYFSKFAHTVTLTLTLGAVLRREPSSKHELAQLQNLWPLKIGIRRSI